MKGGDCMEVIRVYAESTGFDELYEGYIRSQLENMIDREKEKQKENLTGEVDE